MSGAWDEDLDNFIGVFEMLTAMCGVGESEKRLYLYFMLSWNSISLFYRLGRDFQTFRGGVEVLRNWSNSNENRPRNLTT